jgi:hypothetical protein
MGMTQLLSLALLATLVVLEIVSAAPFGGDFGDVLFREKREDTRTVAATVPDEQKSQREKRQLVWGFADGATSGTILGRKKRQLMWGFGGYADGLTSGTILGRKKRQIVWGFADGLTSGTILG